ELAPRRAPTGARRPSRREHRRGSAMAAWRAPRPETTGSGTTGPGTNGLVTPPSYRTRRGEHANLGGTPPDTRPNSAVRSGPMETVGDGVGLAFPRYRRPLSGHEYQADRVTFLSFESVDRVDGIGQRDVVRDGRRQVEPAGG